MKIAICDDDNLALGAIKGAVENAFAKNSLNVSVDEYSSTKALHEAMQSIEYDLLMLDIDMPQVSGIDFGVQLRQEGVDIDILYVSSCENLVFESFSVKPLGFIRKNSFFADLSKYIPQIIAKHDTKQKNIVLQRNTQMITVAIDAIMYVEAVLKEQHFYLENEPTCLVCKKTMKELVAILEESGFIRAHNSFLVNYKYISVIKNNEVLLKNGKSIPVSRRHIVDMREKYLMLMKSSGAIRF